MYSELVILSIANNYMIDSFSSTKDYNLMGAFHNNENKFLGTLIMLPKCKLKALWGNKFIQTITLISNSISIKFK